VWRGAYEQLRAVVLAGGQPEGDNARRLARFGLAGLVSARPAWQEAPEPRWSGTDPKLAALVSAYSMMTGGTP
jgi:protein tyrosine phosphatase (PTP) superfamily phosphohydrolase (DUF442 family)